MSRIRLLDPAQMTDAQRVAYDATVSGRRGRAPAPFLAWLHSPELAGRAQALGEFVRYLTTLSPRLSELAILVVARYWTSQYEWVIHKAEALKAGVSQAVVDDIAHRRTPRFERPDERAVFDFAMSLNYDKVVPDAVYRAAVEAVGEQGVVELVGLLGYYSLISMTLNAFEIEAPNDAASERLP